MEIYQHREVVGISVLFMAIDLLGGVFSDLSLAFKEHFDVIAGVTYSLVVVSDALHTVLCWGSPPHDHGQLADALTPAT